MRHVEKLAEVQASLLDEVVRAAQDGNVDAVEQLGRRAKECAALQEQAKDLKMQITRFVEYSKERGLGDHNVEATSNNGTVVSMPISAKREGKEAREQWVGERAAGGVQLTGHGKRYQTVQAATVGIAFANELEGKPDKWFLGLRDEPTDVGVLLCKDQNGSVVDLVLPVNEIRAQWSSLSTSGGQIKFNIRREAGRFVLLIPGGRQVDVTQYRSSYGPLR